MLSSELGSKQLAMPLAGLGAVHPAKSCPAISRLNFAVAALGMALVILGSATYAHAQSPNVVIEWNRIVQGVSSSWRPYAMVHIAMFDAVNSIEDAYTPYRLHVDSSHGASQQAAAAQAARDVLASLFPAQQQTFDTALTSQLAGIPPGLAKQGRNIGRQAALAVLGWRQNDGWPAVITPDPEYALPPFPGLWQPTPPANSPATFTFYWDALPFALVSSTQFLPPPPPSVNSERYAADFNEAKELGSANSAARTPEETLLAQLWAGVNTATGFMNVWNNVAGDVAQAQGLTLVETARLFTLVNVSINDGLQTSFTSKFIYGLWRPITAIQRADEDLNAATAADPSWMPLLATPPYPTYSGNAACLASAAARALTLTFGRDDIPFSVTWIRTMGLPNETRHYNGFSQLARQQGRSRIHGGIHFQFDSDASELVCPKVAEYTHAHFMLSR